jgi:hypothetical protein
MISRRGAEHAEEDGIKSQAPSSKSQIKSKFKKIMTETGRRYKWFRVRTLNFND